MYNSTDQQKYNNIFKKRLTADADDIFVNKFLFYLFPEIFNSFAEYDIVGIHPNKPQLLLLKSIQIYCL